MKGSLLEHAKTRPNLLRQAIKKALLGAVPPTALLASHPGRAGELFLTFDDGPHPEHTPAVLDELARARASATFFVIGERAAKHPDIVRRITDEGHTLGHHSYFHTEPAETSAATLIREVKRTSVLLTETTGHIPRFFRPPYGKLTARKLLGLWRAGQTVVLWNADPKDYAAPSGREVTMWFEQHPPCGGDIVLMHDSHPQAAQALPDILRAASARGLSARAL
jgi:peptidoglycan-N-acetylglucosamine deacetylase